MERIIEMIAAIILALIFWGIIVVLFACTPY